MINTTQYRDDITARPRSKIEITCQNPACPYFLKEEEKDIVKRGKNRARHQQYYCNHCQTWFVETANIPLYHKHLSEQEIEPICKHLIEKNGIRSIEYDSPGVIVIL